MIYELKRIAELIEIPSDFFENSTTTIYLLTIDGENTAQK